MTPANPRDLTEATIDRACSEFLEMPGLRLTAVQAQRLWGFDKATCARVLDFLVAAAFLTRDARGTYRRLTDGTARPLVPEQKGWIEDFRLAGRLETPVLLTTHDAARREAFARFIHGTSTRASGPFVAYPGTLKARSARSRQHRHTEAVDAETLIQLRFDEARPGTLYLEDLAALTREAQAKLHALLDDASTASRHPAPRLISGASRMLADERANGSFHEPLFYRLNILHIDLEKGRQPAKAARPSHA